MENFPYVRSIVIVFLLHIGGLQKNASFPQNLCKQLNHFQIWMHYSALFSNFLIIYEIMCFNERNEKAHFVTQVNFCHMRSFFSTSRNRELIFSSDVVASELSPQFDSSTPPPKCTYSIRRDSLDGPKIHYAIVGQNVFHVWECQIGKLCL